MTFSYDGSKYQGYQKQKKEKTIQQEIETVLSKIAGNQTVSIYASGRTDAKVHAINQKAHFDLETNLDIDRLKYSMNSLLPGDIYVKQLQKVTESFHARFDVISKEYIYKLNMGEYNPIEKDYVCQWNKKLDLESMKEALHTLKGTHNFLSFTKKNPNCNDYIRTIIRAELIKRKNQIIFIFEGTGFLRYQVRNMVGTLIEIGSGKRKAEDIIAILEAKDRKKAGIIAPPVGLYLNNVYYDENVRKEKNSNERC